MTLRKFPFSCNYVADEYLKSKGYRKLIVDNYIVFYLIEEENEQVIIMRVYMENRNMRTYFKYTY